MHLSSLRMHEFNFFARKIFTFAKKFRKRNQALREKFPPHQVKSLLKSFLAGLPFNFQLVNKRIKRLNGY